MSIFGESETFEVILSARDRGLTSGLASADHHINRLTESAKRLAEAFVLFEAAHKAVDIFKDVSRAAMDQQAAFKTVQVATTNAGENWRAYGKTVKETLVDQAKAHGFSVETLAQGFVRLESVTKNSAQSFKLLGVAQDLSRARGIPLTTTTLALSKAVEGNTTSLQRYGIIIPKVTVEADALRAKHAQLLGAHVKLTASQKTLYSDALRLAQAHDKQATALKVLGVVTGTNAGQADAYGKTAAGAYDRAKVSIDEFEASIGRKLLPAEAAALSGLSKWVDGLSKSKRVQDDAKEAAHDLASAFHATVNVLETVGPPLLEIADDVKAVVEAVGGVGPILAFGAAWYTAAKGVSAGSRAIAGISKFSTLPVPGAGGSAGRAASTASVLEREAAVAVPAATGFTFGSSTGEFSRQAASVEADATKAERAIAEVGTTAEKTGPSVAGFGTALAGAFNPVTAAVIGVGILAGTLYYLSTETTKAGRAAQNTQDQFDSLAGAAKKFRSSTASIGDDRRSVTTDRLSVRQASLQVTQARDVLADPAQNRTLLQRRENVLAVAQAEDAWRRANHELQGDLELTKRDTKGAGDAAKETQKHISTLADDLHHQGVVAGDAAKNMGRYQGLLNNDPSAVAAANFKAAAANLDAFAGSLDKAAAKYAKTNPQISNAAKLTSEFARSQGRVPTKAETVFIFQHAKADTDLKTITTKVKEFDDKKATAQLALAGYDTVVGHVQNLKALLDGLNGKPVVIPVAYTTSGTPPKKPGGRSGMAPLYTASSGASLTGGYGADDIHVLVTGSEAILNPRQIALVNGGMSVGAALSSTGAPTITRGGGYATGGNPITAFDNIPATATTTSKGKGKGTSGTKGASHSSTSGKTPLQVAQDAWSHQQSALDNSTAPLDVAYARDQANPNATKAQLARDLRALIGKYQYRVRTSTTARGDERYKRFADVVGSINQEISGDYGSIGGYRSDLTSLLNPSGAAPGADAYTKKSGAISFALSVDQTNAGKAIPTPIVDKRGRVTNAAAISNAKRVVARAKADIKPQRAKLIRFTQERIAALQKMRKQRKFKPLWGAIFDEIQADKQTLLGYQGDQNTDDTTAQTDAANAAQQAAQDAAANKFDDSAFNSQVGGLQAAIAADEAALGAGQSGSSALTSDTQRLYDLVAGRVGDVQAILGSLPNQASKDAATAELQADFGILSGITQGSTGAGGSVAGGGSSSSSPTPDQAAQIAQLQRQVVIAQRSAGLSDAALRAFSGSGDIGSGGYSSALSSATGSGPTIVINTLHPGDPATLQAIGDAATSGQSLQSSIPSSRVTVNY